MAPPSASLRSESNRSDADARGAEGRLGGGALLRRVVPAVELQMRLRGLGVRRPLGIRGLPESRQRNKKKRKPFGGGGGEAPVFFGGGGHGAGVLRKPFF